MTPAPADGARNELLQRIRASLPDERLREQRMFGLIAVMADDAMA